MKRPSEAELERLSDALQKLRSRITDPEVRPTSGVQGKEAHVNSEPPQKLEARLKRERSLTMRALRLVLGRKGD